MLSITRLPRITFVEDRDRETVLELSESGRVIRALSQLIRSRFEGDEQDAIGIIFPAGPLLVLSWLAVLDAGKTPVILSYPTRKLSKEYWCETIYHTCDTLGVQCIITNETLAATDLNRFATILTLSSPPEPASESCEAVDGHIVQLSSGTTGHKKAVRFPLGDFERHVLIYNHVLQLSESDRIVSWLPLYHDMGFVACFVMPLYLGVPISMMDPMTWVADNQLLFQTIDRDRGTVCFLPNFAFEVMSRVEGSYRLQTMRHWISCSEPTYPDTIRRFCSTHKVSPATVSTCYAMAENIFAVSQSQGFRTAFREGREYVSCGRLLPETRLKIVDEEIFVRSATSITGYLEKRDSIRVADAGDFYPTGDVGFMDGDELVICGRKRDIMIQAGRKFLLNDLDYTVNAVVPECQGRAACLAKDDAKIGTQALSILIEQVDLCADEFVKQSREALSAALPVESFSLDLVPPGFITKTSSGKINRAKTLSDFERAQQRWQTRQRHTARMVGAAVLASEIKTLIGRAAFDVPLRQFLDSLGYISLQILAHDHGIDVNPNTTVDEILNRATEMEQARREASEVPVLRIVSMMDADQALQMTVEDLSIIADELGVAVYWENLCMPPAEIVYYDFLFENFFLCRDDPAKYEAYVGCLDTMRSASVLLFDDYQEFWFAARGQSYPIMSFGLRRQPVADLLCVRTPRYFRNHHLLPVEDLVHGPELDFRYKDDHIDRIGRLTGAAVFRVAVCEEYSAYTAAWELRSLRPANNDANGPRPGTLFVEKEQLLSHLTAFLRERRDSLRLGSGPAVNTFLRGDDRHMCAACLNPNYLDAIIHRFDRFLIQGPASSVPYLRKRITDLGKSFQQAVTMSIDNELSDGGEKRFDCIIQAGAMGTPKTTLPIFSLQSADFYRGMTLNAPDDLRLDDIPMYLSPARASAVLAKK
jgi:acyl-CoA synthetase (AMP-forming)/AMP-acid ligase II